MSKREHQFLDGVLVGLGIAIAVSMVLYGVSALILWILG